MGTNKSKTWIGVGLLLGPLFFIGSAQAQVYSQNIVGYYNLTIYAGNNFIANQLSNGSDTLSNIFNEPVPEGSTFTEWDSLTQQYLTPSVYDTNSGWSIDYLLTYGEGGLLNAPTTFTNTFVGDVWSGFSGMGAFVPPVISSNGTYLISSYIPMSAAFYDVVGTDPQAGDSVTILDPVSQTETTTTYTDGAWDNGDPVLNVGESALFNLTDLGSDVIPAPEPGTLGLAAVGSVLLAVVLRRRYYGKHSSHLS